MNDPPEEGEFPYIDRIFFQIYGKPKKRTKQKPLKIEKVQCR